MNELLITTNISLLYEPGSGGGLRPPQDMYIYPHAEPQPTSLSLIYIHLKIIFSFLTYLGAGPG